ncbi:MAG: ABC transporter permease [Gaiellaceae bacterium]
MKRARAPVALAVPAVAAVALVLLPLAYLILRAGDGGLDALHVLGRPGTLDLVGKTALLVGAVTVAAIAIGRSLAWLVTRTDLPARRLIAVLATLPLVIPSYVAALALLGALGPRGLLQRLLEGPLGVERLPEIYGFVGAWLALTLSTYPYVFLLSAAALRGLDPAPEEAARALGHSGWSVFRRVTLPTLRPSLGAGSLLVALYTLSDFGAVSLMQYDALTRSIYLQYRSLFDRTPAAVLALVLVALTIVLLVLEERSRRGVRLHRSGSGADRPAPLVPLRRWRWPALAFCGAVVTAFLLAPVGVLVYWSARAVDLGYGISFAWEAALSSLSVGALAAAAAVLAVLPVAFLAHRYPSGWTRTIERLAFTGNALPGIVIALSLVFFAANYAEPLYQTLALLVFAYVVRFFPQALAGVGSALHAVNPRVEEAARSLGRGPVLVLVTVTVPLIRRGLLAGGALVFLNAMKELPATLLLRPIGFETLATEIWKYTSLSSYSRAAPPALLLILVSAPVVYLLAARRSTDLGAPG